MSLTRNLVLLLGIIGGCYVPAGPEIYSTHVSCHWNDGFDDYMWIFQAWVDHPVHPAEVDEVVVFLHDFEGNIHSLPMEYSNATLWKNIPKEKDTSLECGKRYLIDFIASDAYGYNDYVRVNY